MQLNRYLRFSVRTLLVVLTIALVVLGWRIDRANEQRSAIKGLHGEGFRVLYYYEVDDEPVRGSRMKKKRRASTTSQNLPPLTSLVLGGNVVRVQLSNDGGIFSRENTKLSDICIEYLADLPLQRLTVSFPLDEHSITALGRLPDLDELTLLGNESSDARALARLRPDIEIVDLEEAMTGGTGRIFGRPE